MELCGFPHKDVGDACYFPAAYIQKYLNDFTDHFNLRPCIKVCKINSTKKENMVMFMSVFTYDQLI